MINNQMVNKIMKLMYKKPETESISVKTNTTLCASGAEPQTPQTVGFGTGDAIGGGENL